MVGTKRKNGQDSPSELYSNKSRAKPTVEARVDPTYGQRSALPGLDEDANIEEQDEELEYDDQDALSYLRAVRQEATGIPNLIVAPHENAKEFGREIYESGIGDFRGWYEDGAYCAAPEQDSQISYEAGEEIEVEEEVKKELQLAYFDSILARYETLRSQLLQTPPVEAVDALDKDHPTYLGKLNTETARWWRWKMRQVDPVPVQIASMDKATVLRLLGLLTTGTLLKRGAEVQVGISRWAWSLLARLPERGELTSEEIGVVRELGKKAVLVGVGLAEEQQWEKGMDEVEAGFDDQDDEDGVVVVNSEEIDLDEGGFDDSELGDKAHGADLPDENSNRAQIIGPQLPTNNMSAYVEEEGGEEEEEGELPSEDLDAAKARILEALHMGKVEEVAQEAQIHEEQDAQKVKKAAAKWNTKATVDMIITVAGEIYGQRDLLEFRQTWESIE